MNKWRPWLIDIGLLAITFILLLFLFIPWGKKSLAFKKITGTTDTSTDVVVDLPEPNSVYAAAREKIAGLFGYTRPRPAAGNQGGALQPQTSVATWLIPLAGYVVDENSKYLYLFKNSLNNQILKLPIGGVSKGWKLLSVHEGEFLFEFEGKKYIVNKD
jgi:hypothetical protein